MNAATAVLDMPFPEIETEGQDEAAYTQWLRAKVQEAIDDPRPGIPHAQVMAAAQALIEELKARHAQA